MNICNTCKFWFKNDHPSYPNLKSGDCKLLSSQYYDIMGIPKSPPIDWPEPKAGCYPEAGADNAAFVTQPDFGCIQHEPKS